MSHRRTADDLHRAERLLNVALAAAGATTRYLVQGRYGYQGIDRYTAADPADGNVAAGRGRWAMADTLQTALTTTEAALTLEAMLDVVERITT